MATLLKRALASALVGGLISSSFLHTPSSSAEDLPSFKSIARGALSQDSVYFVMTDRFANGNPKNDDAFVKGGPLVNGLDKSDIGYWHGGDFVGLTEKLPYIKGLGFSAIWITPPVVQNWVQQGSAAYHGYWGTDFTTVDPHLGTEAEFRSLVARAHELGMKVIVDIVVNHTADIIFNSYGMYNYAS